MTDPTFRLAVSRFEGKEDKHPKHDSWTLDQLRSRLSDHHPRKGSDGALWSPASYPEGKTRLKNHVQTVCCLVLDMDKGQDPAVWLAKWAGLWFVAHTTFRHTEGAPRWRAVFPLRRPVDAADWPDVWKRLTESLAPGQADRACKDSSRMYYTPTCPPERAAAAWVNFQGGELLDPDAIAPDEAPDFSPPVKRGATIPEGQRDNTLHRIASALRGEGKGETEILAELQTINRDRVVPPLGDADLRRIARSVMRHPTEAEKKARSSQATLSPPEFFALPEIETNNRQLRDVTWDGFAAIVAANDPPKVFVRAGQLVNVGYDERGRARLVHLQKESLRSVLARAADWKSTGKENERTGKRPIREVAPPKDVVDDLPALAPWEGIPALEGLTQCPVLALDGSLRAEEGYHPPAKTYVAIGTPWGVWPGGDGLAAAKWIQDEVLGDFPFADAPSRANAIALMLLPFVRPCIEGPTPLHLIDAPTQGTGKSLLATVCLMPGLGRVHPTTVPKDEESWRKLITSALLEGSPAMFMDNVARKLDSDALAAVLTSTQWTDRALGGNTLVKVPNLCAWVATSNNAKMSPDITRRTVYVRLDSGKENPEERSGFRHPDILSWVWEKRKEIGGACAAMCLHWSRVGMPAGDQRLGSYEEWARTLGGLLGACGVEGFLQNKAALREQVNDEDAVWRAFVSIWWDRAQGVELTSRQLYQHTSGSDVALEIVGGEGTDDSKIRRLGKLLGYRVDKVFSGYRIRKATSEDGNRRFKLVPEVAIEALEEQISIQHAPGKHLFDSPSAERPSGFTNASKATDDPDDPSGGDLVDEVRL